LLLLGLLVGVQSCTLNLDFGTQTLFPTGTAFVLSGTADLIETPEGECLAWLGENGIVYHLFQGALVDNEEYDAVTTPGVTSRLEIAIRTDRVVTCFVGAIVQVQDILEIVE